jgi:hypothetical protein
MVAGFYNMGLAFWIGDLSNPREFDFQRKKSSAI